MRIIECEQGSTRWLWERRGIPTGSNLAKIVTSHGKATTGQARKTYMMELLWERIKDSNFEHYTNPAMERGNKLEPAARQSFAELLSARTGDFVNIEQVGFCKHDTLDCGVSPDGLIGDNCGLEIKTAVPLNHLSKLLANKVPSENVVQIQACMWICECESWWYYLFTDDTAMPNMAIETYRKDNVIDALDKYVPEFIHELNEMEERFYKLYPEFKKPQRSDPATLPCDWSPI